MDWSDRWLGVRAPWSIDAVCWWFVRQVLIEERGLVLSEEGVLAPRDQWATLLEAGAASGEWTRVTAPQDFDVVLAHHRGLYHVGLLASSSILHLHNNRAGAVRHPFHAWQSHGLIRGVYRRAA